MGKKLALVSGYFAGAGVIFILLVTSLLTLLFNSKELHKTLIYEGNVQPKYQALPEQTEELKYSADVADGRVTALDKFFSEYESPLLPYAQLIVDQADQYGLDYRLVPAIAMKESTLCHKIPKNSHNCWGYGIYGGKTTYFQGYDEAIRTVSKGLGERYVGLGLIEPIDIMQKYNPVSTGSWADTVSFVMERISTRL